MLRLLSRRKPALFVYNFYLLVEHSAGEAINRHVYPVMLFTFDDEVILKIVRIGLEMTCLGNHVD